MLDQSVVFGSPTQEILYGDPHAPRANIPDQERDRNDNDEPAFGGLENSELLSRSLTPQHSSGSSRRGKAHVRID